MMNHISIEKVRKAALKSKKEKSMIRKSNGMAFDRHLQPWEASDGIYIRPKRTFSITKRRTLSHGAKT